MAARTKAQKLNATRVSDERLLDEVCAALSYDSATGKFSWKARLGSDWKTRGWNTRQAGKTAGCRQTGGYVKIRYKGCQFLAHRLVWWLFNKDQPSMIDHIDRDTYNNRIDNLRAATVQQNGANMGVTKRNTSGLKGVGWKADKRKWRAMIKVNQKNIHLGYFSNKYEAAQAYGEASRKHFGEFARVAS